MFVRSPYNYDADAVSVETGESYLYDPKEENHPSRSRTQQNQLHDTDINVIVSRFIKTGTLPQVPMPTVADFTESVTDFQTAMNMIVAAERSFMSLPSDVRAYFGNDPQKFLTFVDNADNFDEAVRLGIAKAREEPRKPEPVEVRVINDTPTE